MTTATVKTANVPRFLAVSVLALLVLMPLWYQVAAHLARPTLELAGQFMAWGFDWVKSVQVDGTMGTLRTRLNTVIQLPSGLKGLGELAPKLDYRLSGYGLALLWALLVASWPQRLWLRLPLGTLALVPLQALSLCLTWLQQVYFTSGPDVLQQAAPSAWLREMVAFGFHFNLFMLTPLAPVLIWFALDRQFASNIWRSMLTQNPVRPPNLPH